MHIHVSILITDVIESVCVCVPHQRALHDPFEVDEVQVIGRGGAGGAITHCVQHLGHYNTHTHTQKRDKEGK